MIWEYTFTQTHTHSQNVAAGSAEQLWLIVCVCLFVCCWYFFNSSAIKSSAEYFTHTEHLSVERLNTHTHPHTKAWLVKPSYTPIQKISRTAEAGPARFHRRICLFLVQPVVSAGGFTDEFLHFTWRRVNHLVESLVGLKTCRLLADNHLRIGPKSIFKKAAFCAKIHSFSTDLQKDLRKATQIGHVQSDFIELWHAKSFPSPMLNFLTVGAEPKGPKSWCICLPSGL